MINYRKHLKTIPAEVKIGETLYEVLWCKEFPRDKKQLGDTRFVEKQIIIKENQTPKELLVTYFHEVLHCASKEYGAELTENQVLALENLLTDLIRKGNIFKKVRQNGKKQRSTTNKRKRRNS